MNFNKIMTSPIIIGLLSGIVALIVYSFHCKSRNSKIEKKDLIKMGLLGVFLGIINSFLMLYMYNIDITSASNVLSENPLGNQEIYTGNPDF